MSVDGSGTSEWRLIGFTDRCMPSQPFDLANQRFRCMLPLFHSLHVRQSSVSVSQLHQIYRDQLTETRFLLVN